MAFAGPIRELSSINSADSEEVIARLVEFKNSVRGNPSCEVSDEEESDSVESLNTEAPTYYSYLENFKQNSCTATSSSVVEPVASIQKKCKSEPSFVERLVKDISKLDLEDDNAKINISKFRPLIQTVVERANKYKRMVEDFLISNADDQEKRDVILAYMDSVVVAMRDVFVVLRPHSALSGYFAANFFVKIPSGLFEEYTDDYDFLKLGKNPSTDPYFFNVNDNGDYLEISFDQHSMARRDIQTIVQYPMAKNYLYALRLMTIQMMASQIKTYDVLAGNKNLPIQMPKSCSVNKANGFWPSELNLEVRDDISEGYLDSVLENHGLIYNGSNDLVMNYYIEDSKINPLKDAMYGAVEFNNYTNANKAEKSNTMYTPYLKPSFDDISVFAKFMDLKKGIATWEYSFESQATRKSKSEIKQYKDVLLLNEIISEESPYKFIEVGSGDKKVQVRPFTLNASPYISHKMQELGATNIADIIPNDVKAELQAHKMKLDIPSLYAPSAYRNWGINKIHQVVKGLVAEKDTKSPFVRSFIKACTISYHPFCGQNKNQDLYKHLDDYLSKFNVDGKILPISKLNELGLEKDYRLLHYLWNELRDVHGLIPEANINEYDYLVDQMNVLNPIARVRLSYLLARRDLVGLLNGKKPTYNKTSRGSRITNDYQCHRNNVSGQIARLDKAAATLLLNKPLRPDFYTSYLNSDDSKELWAKTVEEVDSNSSQLFTAKLDEKKVYSYLQDISYKTILDSSDVRNAVSDIMNGDIKSENEDALDESLDSQEVDRIAFFRDLMKEQKHEDRIAMYLDRASEFGIQDDLSLKEQILAVDMTLKRHLYRDVMQRAAVERKMQTYKKLEDICNTNENDHEGLKEHFYATMKVQDNLNQMIGLNAAPADILEKINSMSDEEWQNTGLAIGGFLVGMAGVMLAGSCAVLTGGLCGIAVAGLVTAGMGAQTYVFKSEVDMKLRANESVRHVESMADLGYTGALASDNVSRSWAWAVIEGVSIIPLVGLFARGVNMGTKMTKESIKAIVLNAGKDNLSNVFKHAGKSARTIVEEADVSLAKVVLGFDSYSDKVRHLFTGKTLEDASLAVKNASLNGEQAVSLQNKISKIQRLHTSGRISAAKMKELTKRILAEVQELAIKNSDGLYKYTSNVVTDMSFKSIDKQMAVTVGKYFGGNPSELRGFMGSYMKKFLPKRSGVSKVAKAKAGYEAAKEGKFLTGTNWIRQAWYENTYNLAKNETSFLRIYDELSKLSKADFENYLVRNADELTDIFVKAPLRKRDLPYLFIQGGPHMGGILNGRRLPGIQDIGEAVVVRKIFNARARLISESAKATAREVLGANKVLAADTLSQVFKAFYATTRENAVKLGGAEGQGLLKELAGVRKIVLDSMFEGLTKHPKYIDLLKKNGVNVFVEGKLNKKLLNNLLYESNNMKSEVYADLLWGVVDTQNIFKMKEFEFIAYKVMRETVKDTSVIGVQKYLAMVKVLLMKENLGVVELF